MKTTAGPLTPRVVSDTTSTAQAIAAITGLIEGKRMVSSSPGTIRVKASKPS